MAFCYEHIVDDFFYARYLDFTIVVDNRDRFFNATKLCKDHGKRYSDWSTLLSVKALMKHVASHRQRTFCVYNNHYSLSQHNDLLSGVFVHSDLLSALVAWISPAYYLQAVQLIDKCSSCIVQAAVGHAQYDKSVTVNAQFMGLRDKHASARTAEAKLKQQLKQLRVEIIDSGIPADEQSDNLQHQITECQELIDSLKVQMAGLMEENAQLQQEVKSKVCALNTAEYVNANLQIQLATAEEEERAKAPVKTSLYNFYLVRKNTNNPEERYQYTGVCVQQAGAAKTLSKVKRKYPFHEVVCQLYTQDAGFVKRIKRENDVKSRFNDFSAQDENSLVQLIYRIYSSSIPLPAQTL